MNPHQRFKTITVILIFLMAVSSGYSKKLATLPELTNPEKIIIKYDKIFITQGVEIFIYSFKDFKLLTKFGKSGEGPGEFKINSPDYPLNIDILPTTILVNSLGRVSYFTQKGKLLREKTFDPHWTKFQPIGENLVYESFAFENNTIYRAFYLCNSDFKKIKEFYRQKHILNDKTVTILKEVPKFQVVKDKIFVSGKVGFVIDIFDKNGELLRTIKLPYEKRKVTSKDKKEILDFIKIKYKQLLQGQYRDIIKKFEVAPTFFAINEFRYSEPYLYVSTCKEKDRKREFYIFDSDGKFIGKAYLPLVRQDPIELYPYNFYKNKAYQLVENDDTEAIDLHVFDVNLQKK